MHDLLLRQATLMDGTGAGSRPADVLIDGDGIAAVVEAGSVSLAQAREHVNCEGKVLAPGFLDVHTHDDALLLQKAQIGHAHPKLSQGVTTVITGNCGVSLAPLQASDVPAPLDILGTDQYRFKSFAAYLDALQSSSPICNAACLIGHTTLRVKHMADLSSQR
jgi:N-acyl-D-amino-acid deacylase